MDSLLYNLSYSWSINLYSNGNEGFKSACSMLKAANVCFKSFGLYLTKATEKSAYPSLLRTKGKMDSFKEEVIPP